MLQERVKTVFIKRFLRVDSPAMFISSPELSEGNHLYIGISCHFALKNKV